MAVLHRKLGRDLRGSLGVLIVVIAIIAVGTGSLICMLSAQRILSASQQQYYDDYRFADFWIDLKKAPLTAARHVSELPDVASVHARIVFDVILDVPGEAQPIGGRLISTPPTGIDRTINGICIVRGSNFSADRDEEIIISEAFADAHDLAPGDRLELILNRRRESFIIVGTAISPEYVYMVRGEGDFIPDPQHFGVLYIKEDYARDVLDFQDACNQIVGRLSPGADGNMDVFLGKIDRMLDPYGVLATTPRERQASHRFLSDEIRGLEVSALVLPPIFLAVAALVLNIVMSRLAERQRITIGTLKAIGYSDRSVLTHYLSFGLIVGIGGGLAGCVVGVSLAMGLIEVYKEFYHFPRFVYQLHLDLLLAGMGTSVLFALAGTAKGVWGVLRLEPAESMRPRPPEQGHAIFLERVGWLWGRMGFRTHLALRSLFRNRFRTASGVFSSAVATAIVLLTLAMYDSVRFLVDFQFDYTARSDADIGMRDERGAGALLECDSLPGVDYAEPLFGLTCDVSRGRDSRRVTITGLSSQHRLTIPRQESLLPIDIPESGLVLSRKLAAILHIRAGDRLELRPVRGRRDTVTAPVASIVDGYVGLACYADLRYLSRIVGEARAINGVQVALNPAHRNEFYRAVKQLPNAQGLGVRSNTKANIESTFVATMLMSLGLMIGFATVIGCGSMINTSLVEIGDRLRDVATFRVLGYGPNQIAAIFFRQNLMIFAAGLVLAIPISYGLMVFTAAIYDTELFRMPVLFRWPTVAISGAVASVFVGIAQCLVYRQIRRLDWLEGIKVKE